MKLYLLFSFVFLLSACATTPPWGPPWGHVYGNHHVRNYKGHCPPGLAKKGCIPPGQAKKWRKGYPLPRSVVYYDLSPNMARRLGRPPIGHRFVRVAQDILLIAVGTNMVIDAVYDLNNM